MFCGDPVQPKALPIHCNRSQGGSIHPRNPEPTPLEERLPTRNPQQSRAFKEKYTFHGIRNTWQTPVFIPSVSAGSTIQANAGELQESDHET
jgi:hypothetical protein